MKFKLVIITAFLLLLTISVSGQQADETIIPQAVKTQIQELQNEIKENNYSFSVGYNPALSYTLAQLCGLRVPKGWQANAKINNISVQKPQALSAEAVTVTAPAKWDWREKDGVTPIRNQGSCGSCWAFGTISTFESLLRIKNDTIVDLSEQHLVSCNELDYGCNGGWWIHDMLMDPGAVMEADFPYAAADKPCGGPYNYPFKLSGWSYIDGDDNIPDVTSIKNAIMNYGPVCAAVYVGSAFQSYTGGVFDKEESETSGFLCCSGSSKQVNHAIVLAGWDDSKGAWILRNSWGSGWGDDGYMYIKYGVNKVGFAAVVVY